MWNSQKHPDEVEHKAEEKNRTYKAKENGNENERFVH